MATTAAGGCHALAVLGGGSVQAWGDNTHGNLGDGTTTQRTGPVAVSGLTGVVAVGAGQSHNVAVTSSGEVWTWGHNEDCQLGDGTDASRLTPVKVAEAGFAWKAATPALNPPGGTYSTSQSVEITSATSGATLRYTTDGSDPTAASAVYGGALSVTTSRTVRTRAFRMGLADSNVAEGTYTLVVATPTLIPGSGSYSTPQTVTMSTTTAGATIRYTTDGSDPTAASPLYGGPLSVGTTTTLKAAAFLTGWTPSGVATGTYSMNFGPLAPPTLTPVPQSYLDSTSVTISALAGSTIRYTTDGSDPTEASTLYTSPVPLSVTTTLKAAAWHADYSPSPVSSGTYTIQVAPPTGP